MVSNRNLSNPNDYVRMFAAKSSLAYLLSEVFLGHYNSLEVLSVQDSGYWMSFLPQKSQEKTLIEGKKLYTSKNSFQKYNREFHRYIKSSSKYFQSILKGARVSVAEAEKFLQLASKHFFYYSKTEFFYTDSVDQGDLVITVQEFDKLKMDGRTHLNKLIFEERGYVRSLLTKLSWQTGVPKHNLMGYGIKELMKLVKNGSRISDQAIKDREIFFMSRDLNLSGSEAKPLVDQFFATYRGVSSIIKGTIANKGKVKGRARVLIPDFREFDKISVAVAEMKKGEILVAETTAPEIIAACKKAAAIVTNQGGMLSHAAIVSREMGKPCIIGTKIATQVLKDGDLVEVDADRGIVKIIK